ncbi:MAG: Fe-S cluster assembly protein SufD [Acidimicrobiaceae bacterium]|nr:Fe-S cluster assembly protein SufD [Acidimicrobiaceae bacterium]MDE0605875.1 Fe-S cluster assembly protein SufD [Acidimicrobiaceae bacterium]MDE0606490.1 Fe-S cluster assembly protein SufD [Acidimicrobiaceae bacterium]
MTDFSTDAARSLAGPAWLVDRRVGAAETFAASAPPDVADEEWRYSAIREFDLSDFVLSSTTCDAPTLEFAIDSAAVVHTVNGRVASVEMADDLVDAGVYVGPLAGVDAGSALLGAVSVEASDYFTVLNDAFAAEPILIRVPSGVVVQRPIVVTHHVSGGRVAAFPRLVVDVGTNAQAEVLDYHTSDSGPLLVCPVTELDVAAAGRLGYLNVQQLGSGTWQFSSQLARAGRDATLTASTAAFGGGYARTRSDVRLAGRGANCDLSALYFGDGRQGLDFRTYQDHVAADTTSNLLYKGVVSDESRSIYTGLIRVRPDARGTNAFQTNRNLKLGENAWVESVPNLEIENNDVRCSHASAVGPVDAEQQFYLESRGVPTGEAERLIVAGFLDEVLESLPVTAMRQQLRSAVDAKLDRQAQLSHQTQAEEALS